ncbi:hypothetical protein ACJX0J_036895, partial [Zea mays]
IWLLTLPKEINPQFFFYLLRMEVILLMSQLFIGLGQERDASFSLKMNQRTTNIRKCSDKSKISTLNKSLLMIALC